MPNPKSLENLIKFKPGQSGNPRGRPKKTFKSFAEKMKKEGFEPLSRDSYIDALAIIFSLPQDKLEEIAKDPEQPLYLRLTIMSIADPTERAKAMSEYRDYAFGKAKQHIDHTTDGEKINQVTVFELPANGREEK